EASQEPLETGVAASKAHQDQSNILETLKLDQALRLAKKKAKEGSLAEAKRIYQDVLVKFPKNKRAIDGIKALAGRPVGKASKVQDPRQDQLQSLINLYSQGQLQQALKQAETLVQQFPKSPVLFNIQGVVLKGLGQLDQSIEAYNKALAIKPDYADAYYNMGNALKEQGKLEKAMEAYNKALAIKPDNAEAYNNMGLTLQDQGKLEEAIEAYNKALAIKPDFAEAHYNMGNALQEQGKLDEAMDAYNEALAIKPDFETVRALKLYKQARICDWDGIAEDRKLIPGLGTSKKFTDPFTMLSLEDAPDRHRLRSEIYAKAKYPHKPMPLPAKPLKKPERLRIGYFSPDFNDHPIAQMIEGVFRHHDRSKFEILAYSFSPKKDSKMHQKIKSAVDIFRDVKSLNAKDIARLARTDRLDIAIDLAGYTKNSKTEIFSERAAPIQINYLGYPGTMGADFIDYIIADKTLIPYAMRSHYSEKIISMPNTYQPTNDTLVISKDIPSKNDLGLPENAFVFCAINQSFKITPTEFDIWMRLLNKVECSVLWLKAGNDLILSKLRMEARKRGINPSRLIFANKIAHEQYLAQFKQADLYLDTFNYNAGTTASDVLMAGLPIVTKMGESYASRMAASLLKACDMNDLITETPKEYEELALELATNPIKLQKLRERLQENTKITSIFDTALYTGNLEEAYQQAYNLYYSGDSVQNIEVKAKEFSENLDVLS
ncbi:tetratricopeptide repeat protein, partial [Planktomarina temperata]|nr:tetratricopeptide repeat protein [Planktomarina temperata]